MSYSATTDFLALLRRTSGGVRSAEVPGLDYLIAAMARAGQFLLYVGQIAPTSNQQSTVWLRPANPSWSAESSVYLYNITTAQYELATPALWAILVPGVAVQVVQDVAVAGPVNVQTDATVIRVMAGVPVTLIMPLSATKVGGVLVSDWANLAGANNITIQRSGGDVFPNGATSYTIAGNGGSAFFRPVSGGYAL